jgi:ribosomal-protein-alanine N-acetyltransferase
MRWSRNPSRSCGSATCKRAWNYRDILGFTVDWSSGALGQPATREETREGIEWSRREYETRGYSFYATVLKAEGRVIGRCGLLHQHIEGTAEVEVAYGLAPAYWGRGLATEAAQALQRHAFCHLGVPRVVSIIDPENVASQRVAEKNGMRRERTILFHGQPCYLYTVQNPISGFSKAPP